MQDKNFASRRQLYSTVFAQCFSPCGKYLTAANNYGDIAVFSLPAALSPDATDQNWKAIFTFKACSGPVYCLTSTDKHLISGGSEDIIAWSWMDILNKTPRVIWSLRLPRGTSFTEPEVNSIAIDKNDTDRRLYAGCGDNCVHIWDLETGTLSLSLKGHEDYVHCVALMSNRQECVSASEDGSVRVWDTRTPSEAVHVIEPYKEEECVGVSAGELALFGQLPVIVVIVVHNWPACARPEFGKWIGCVTVDPADDWLVCGGGPSLSVWHMRSLTPTTTFHTPKGCQQYVQFYEDYLVSAGTQPHVNHWFINGDSKAQVPCTPTSVFDVSINQSENNKVLSVAGNSPMIDIFTNFGYKAFSLTFVPTS